jgi:flavin reductase (DIM6/NTAB) family NADH-FMN oxidoreductase RutF
MKKSVPIKQFWYSDIVVFPKIVTIITTVNEAGKVNAAPYAYFMHYDVLNKNPRIFLGMRKFTHTYQNISKTGEFVINFPSADYLEDIMETCRFYPEGVNELEHTRFTEIPSQKVAPPSIKECGQIIECKLNKQYDLDKIQAHIIGDIVALVFDEELIDLGREERFRRLNLPIGLGDEKRKYFYFGLIEKIEMLALKPPPKDDAPEEEIKTSMDWDPKAFKELQDIPAAIRQMVVEMSEDLISEEGADKVTYERYMKLVEEFAPKDLQNRFDEDADD